MDIFKKMFGLNKQPLEKDLNVKEDSQTRETPALGFKKPLWYDEESDDELFDTNKMAGFQMFSSPMEIQKYHEQQMQQLIKSLKQMEGVESFMDENWRDEYMKPGFEVFKNFENVKPSADVDLDGEIYADQLHSLLQRISTAPGLDELKTNLNRSDNKTKRKMTDDEKILNQIHCLDDKNEFNAQFHVAPKADERQPRMQTPQNGGVFEGFIDGPKYHRQAFSYQLVRRPNGSVLTKTTTDSNGNTKTVIETTVDGERKIQTLVNGVEVIDGAPIASNKWTIDYGRHLYINKDGYALPKNLW